VEDEKWYVAYTRTEFWIKKKEDTVLKGDQLKKLGRFKERTVCIERYSIIDLKKRALF
jgi:hypothetical protein